MARRLLKATIGVSIGLFRGGAFDIALEEVVVPDPVLKEEVVPEEDTQDINRTLLDTFVNTSLNEIAAAPRAAAKDTSKEPLPEEVVEGAHPPPEKDAEEDIDVLLDIEDLSNMSAAAIQETFPAHAPLRRTHAHTPPPTKLARRDQVHRKMYRAAKTRARKYRMELERAQNEALASRHLLHGTDANDLDSDSEDSEGPE